MKKSKQLERWDIMLAQAQRFAELEQHHDGLRRAELVLEEVERAVAGAGTREERVGLERYLHRVQRELVIIESKYDAWRASIAAIRDARRQYAPEEMRQKLPV